MVKIQRKATEARISRSTRATQPAAFGSTAAYLPLKAVAQPVLRLNIITTIMAIFEKRFLQHITITTHKC